MRKSKKLIALLCAMAMIFSAFGVFTITASAADDVLILSQPVVTDGGKTITVEATVDTTKFSDGVKAYAIYLDLPLDSLAATDNWEEDPHDVGYCISVTNYLANPGSNAGDASVYLDTEVIPGRLGITTAISGDPSTGALYTGNKIATIEFKLDSALDEAYDLELEYSETSTFESFISGKHNGEDVRYGVKAGTMGSSKVTIPVDGGDVTPATTAPVPTEAVTDAPVVPTPTPTYEATRPEPSVLPTSQPVESFTPDVSADAYRASFTLTQIENADPTVITIRVGFVSTNNRIASYQVDLPFEADLIADAATGGLGDDPDQPKKDITYTEIATGYNITPNYKYADGVISIAAARGNDWRGGADLMDITIKLKNALTQNKKVVLGDNSTIAVGTSTADQLKVGLGTLPAAFVELAAYVPPVVRPDVTGTTMTQNNSHALKDYLGAEAQTKAAANTQGNGYWFDVEFYDANDAKLTYGTDVQYGRDFVAYWDNGTEPLTQDEYELYMSGRDPYTGADLPAKEIADKLKFAYNNSGSVKGINAILVDDQNYGYGSDTMQNPDGSDRAQATDVPTVSPTVPATNDPNYPGGYPGGYYPGGYYPGGGYGYYGDGYGTGNNGTIFNGGTTAPSVDGNETPFNDLGNVTWAIPAINYLYNTGIIAGRTSTLYDPDATVTRAEFTKMVVGAVGLGVSNNAPSFADAQDHWAAGYIATAEAYGIVTGYTADSFAPDKTINRQEMAAIVYRAAGAVGKSLPAGSLNFADAGQIDDYAKAPVASLQAAGIINGVGNNMFAPKDNATRAQSAVIIFNYITK